MKKTVSTTKLPQWDLTTLVKSEKEIERIQQDISNRVKAFQSYREKLSNPTSQMVQSAVNELKIIGELSSQIGAYADLWFSENTKNEHAKSLDAKISSFLSEQGNQTIFFSLWWKNLDEKTAQSLLPATGDDRFFLIETRRYKPYLLTEPEEKIINTKDVTGSEALAKLYGIITNSFSYAWKEKGKIKQLTREEISSYVRSQKLGERIQAYDTVWNTYQQHEGTLGEIYQNLVRDALTEDLKMRHYQTPQSPRNLSNQLSDELVNSFLSVCRKNAPIFQDYFQWKMKRLKVPYSRYHLYAPIPHREQPADFEESFKLVMNVFGNFSPRIQQLAQKVRTENRLDAVIRPGKRSGAFCYGVTPKQTSFVMLNWTGKDRDVSTLAHELGHAVHNHLAANHTILTHHAGLPLAETASTFAEMLLDEHLLSQSNSPTYQEYLLAQQIDDAYGTIGRQSFFALFEKEAFQLIQEGKTTPELSDAYEKNLKQQFGSMKLPSNARYEWLSIPHFYYSPFYVYAYSFGQLLVLSLFEQYQEEGKSFVPKYEKFLSYGGSKLPQDMLMEMGFDPREEHSWQKGFDLIKEKIKQVKKISKR